MSTNRKGLQAVATAAPKPKTAERTLKAEKIYQPTSMIFPEVGEKIFFFFSKTTFGSYSNKFNTSV